MLDVCKLIVDGLKTRAIREELSSMRVNFDESEKSIALLERLLRTRQLLEENQKLNGLREAQLIRTKLKAHRSGRDAQAHSRNAIQNMAR